MVLQYRGSAGTPGPLGTTPGTLPGGLYAPLAFKEVSDGGSATKAAAKALPMPAAVHNDTIIRAKVVPWKLSDGAPVTKHVKQGALWNCPVAAILAALGNTKDGRAYLDGQIIVHSHTSAKTVLAGDVLAELHREGEDPDDKPQETELKSGRYFEVKLKNLNSNAREIHDVFYVKYSDGADFDLVYMNSPSDVLWPAVFEKAVALHYGSYGAVNGLSHTANDFWELLMGTKPKWGLDIKDSTSVREIQDAIRDAPRVPTLAASKFFVSEDSQVKHWHGHAVISSSGDKVQLYDPAAAEMKTVGVSELQKNFAAILSGTP